LSVLGRRWLARTFGLAYDAGTGRRFGKEELEVLSRFAQLASVALDNARLYSTAHHSIARGSVLPVSLSLDSIRNANSCSRPENPNRCRVIGSSREARQSAVCGSPSRQRRRMYERLRIGW